MLTQRRSERRFSSFLAILVCFGGAGVATAACGFSGTTAGTGTGGQSSSNGGSGSNATAGTGNNGNTQGGSVNPGGGNVNPSGGNVNPSGGDAPTGGSVNPGAGTGPQPGNSENLEYSGSFPEAPIKFKTMPNPMLHFTKKVIHSDFLAESCSIADYNGDKVPDVSSGRIWYQGPDFTVQHPFRDGHGVLPATGDGPELNTGVSDDWADYPFDMDGDGDYDIINIAQCDVPEANSPTADPTKAGTPNKIGTVQVHATAVWYENPGMAGQAGDPKWTPHLMHSDVRLEQHGLVDINGDGYPEIYGACKQCDPPTTKGYYQGDKANPKNPWVYHSVTGPFTFPFGGLGWMHGEGAGDVNGDGWPDLLERSGAWISQSREGTWSQTPCTGRDPETKKMIPAGCGYVKENFYDGQPDSAGNKGGSHMYATDMDMDGIPDVVAADWAHGEGLYWYKQSADGKFTKYQFMGSATGADPAKWGAGFSEPHSLQVVDMDGDGRPDIVTGKMRFAHPRGQGDPDLDGIPYIYVFKNVATMDARTGAPITLQPIKVDPLNPDGQIGKPGNGVGVGRQLAVGHVNTDGIMDICVGTKVGLAVFYGSAQ